MKSIKFEVAIVCALLLIFGCSKNQSLEKFTGTWEEAGSEYNGATYHAELQIKGNGTIELAIFQTTDASTNKMGLIGTCKVKRNKLEISYERELSSGDEITDYHTWAELVATELIVHTDSDHPDFTKTYHRKGNNQANQQVEPIVTTPVD